MALEDEQITFERAWELAKFQPDPEQRADALRHLLTWATPQRLPDGWEQLNVEATAAAQAIPDPGKRAQALGKLADASARTAAITVANTIRDPEKRAQVMAALGAWADALTAVRTVTSPWEQARILGELAGSIPPDHHEEAIAIGQRLAENGRYLTQALLPLLPHLSQPHMSRLAEWVWTLNDRWAKGKLAAALTPFRPPEELPDWLHRLQAVAEAETYPTNYIQLWTAFSEHFPQEKQAVVLAALLETGRTIENPMQQAEALGSIALHLPLEKQQAIFDEAAAQLPLIPDQIARDRLWGDWAKGLCRTGVETAVTTGLEMMTNVSTEYLRTGYLQEVTTNLMQAAPDLLLTHAPRILPTPMVRTLYWRDALPDLPDDFLPAVWADITGMDDETARRLGMLALVPRLPQHRRQIVQDALAAVEKEPSLSPSASLPAAIARHLPEQRMALIARGKTAVSQWDTANQAYLLAGMVKQLGDAAPASLLDETTATLSEIGDVRSRLLAWTSLFPVLPAHKQQEWSPQVMSMTLGLEDRIQRTRHILELLPHLSDEWLLNHWTQLLPAINPMQLPDVINLVVARLPAELLEKTLDFFIGLPMTRMREKGSGIQVLAPHLSPDLQEPANMAAQEIRFPHPRIQALASLAALRAEPDRSVQLNELLAEARKITISGSRALALVDVGSYVEDGEKTAVFQEALTFTN